MNASGSVLTFTSDNPFQSANFSSSASGCSNSRKVLRMGV